MVQAPVLIKASAVSATQKKFVSLQSEERQRLSSLHEMTGVIKSSAVLLSCSVISAMSFITGADYEQKSTQDLNHDNGPMK